MFPTSTLPSRETVVRHQVEGNKSVTRGLSLTLGTAQTSDLPSQMEVRRVPLDQSQVPHKRLLTAHSLPYKRKVEVFAPPPPEVPISSKICILSYNSNGCSKVLQVLQYLFAEHDAEIMCLQEHKLLKDNYEVLLGIADNINFTAVAGAAIVYRDNACIEVIPTFSERFCAIRWGSLLVLSVYLPTDNRSEDSRVQLIATLSDLEAFLSDNVSDKVVLMGDFNVDFSRDIHFTRILKQFLSRLDFVVRDLNFPEIEYTYESMQHDNCRSWLDHVVCNRSSSGSIIDISVGHTSGTSDHFPLIASLQHEIGGRHESLNVQSNVIPKPLWHKATDDNLHVYKERVSVMLTGLMLSDDLVDCELTECLAHKEGLKKLAYGLITGLDSAARDSIPFAESNNTNKVFPRCRRHCAGWNDMVKPLDEIQHFWHQEWKRQGCPQSGLVSDLKRVSRRKYSRAARKCCKDQEKFRTRAMARALVSNKQRNFWDECNRAFRPKRQGCANIEGERDPDIIARMFRDHTQQIYCSQDPIPRESLLQELKLSIGSSDVREIEISPETILLAIRKINSGKMDGNNISSDHLKQAPNELHSWLARFFTSLVRHTYMPNIFSEALLIPIPKPGKDSSRVNNYRLIAIASMLSKVLEWAILLTYSFSSCDLQMGFKPGLSTTMATAVVKAVVRQHRATKSPVFAALLDASRAFDTIDHGRLFRELLNSGCPKVLVLFLLQWYCDQSMSVRWKSSVSSSFKCSNGVRQGGVMSPVLFAIYLDALLLRLKKLGIGCHYGDIYSGAIAYADDVILLAPSAYALRCMLKIASDFGSETNIHYNGTKTQFIIFNDTSKTSPDITFEGSLLSPVSTVTHLGHILQSDLGDTSDILDRVSKTARKSAVTLQRFWGCDSSVKSKLVLSFCYTFYGAALWKLDSRELQSVDIGLRKIARRIFSLPYRSSSRVTLLLSDTLGIHNIVANRTESFLRKSRLCPNPLVRSILLHEASDVRSQLGYNIRFSLRHRIRFWLSDYVSASVIRDLRSTYSGHISYSDQLLAINRYSLGNT